MKSIVKFSNFHESTLPKQFRNDDNRYTEAFVEYFLKMYTKKNDLVLDPFAGYGTTLLVCEKMNRQGYAIEFNSEKVKYIKTLLKHPNSIIQGDVRTIESLDLPGFDFLITSPPYMNKYETSNPFDVYKTKNSYQEYLNDICSIFKNIKLTLKKNAICVIEVSNLITKNQFQDSVTTLAWDISKEISKFMNFKGEIIAIWEGKDIGDGTYGYGYDHSYCLVFSNS